MGCNEQNGFDLVNFTDLVQKKASYSNLVFSETAKVVVDIECSINLKDVSDLSNRASGLKAHLGEVGPCGLSRCMKDLRNTWAKLLHQLLAIGVQKELLTKREVIAEKG